MLYEVLLVIDLIVAIMLIGLILIQQGKGADMGASFGGGGSNTVFGSTGSGNFLTKSTAILATIFFVVSIALGNLSNNQGGTSDTWETLESPAATEVPVANPEVPVATAPAVSGAGDVPTATPEEATEETEDSSSDN